MICIELECGQFDVWMTDLEIQLTKAVRTIEIRLKIKQFFVLV